MTKREKQMAAAMAAVSAYMQQEQEVLLAELAPPAPPKLPTIELNLWGQSGRQSMMHLRNLMQLKAFNRLR